MRLSKRGRYATRALLDLAQHNNEGPVQLKDVARREQIPLRYLEHLIAPLVNAGILRSTRGARGGVWLTRDPREVRLSEVIELLEGAISPAECVTNPTLCSRSTRCAARDVWSEVKRAISRVLEGTTLQDMVENQKQKEQRDEAMYHI